LNWAVIIIGIVSGLLLVRELGVIQGERLNLQRERAWPQFEETYISGLQSGISISDTFSFVNDFELPELREPLKVLVLDLDRGKPLVSALSGFQAAVKLEHADLFVAIVSLAFRSGGQNLVQALNQHVHAVRLDIAARGDIRARQNAILAVAKLGLLAPWILLLVLSASEQTRKAFMAIEGQFLLFAGFGVSFIAYRLVVAAGRASSFKRIFEPANG
jgi:tight adherence protein B